MNVKIVNAASDGLDADFATGKIDNSIFEHIGYIGGGDAIDVSGSEVVVTNTRIHDIADKALSVGESSTIVAEMLSISDSTVGAASKDGSQLTIGESTFKGIENTALMAYVKKPEYGVASIEASNLTMEDVQIPAQAQTDNHIRIDGREIKTTALNVKNLYETSMKPGRRK